MRSAPEVREEHRNLTAGRGLWPLETLTESCVIKLFLGRQSTPVYPPPLGGGGRPRGGGGGGGRARGGGGRGYHQSPTW